MAPAKQVKDAPAEAPSAPTEVAPTEVAPRNVVEAIVAVMRKVRAVSKDETNTQYNFNFRGIDAVVNALGPVMREVGLIATPQLRTHAYEAVEVGGNRTRMGRSEVVVSYLFSYSNPETGEMSSLAAEVPGEAMDSGDKSTAKAMSVAFRICLLQQFALPTTERDPDADSYELSPAKEALTNEHVLNGIRWAWKEADLDAAFDSLPEKFAELYSGDLAAVQMTTSDDETVSAPEFIERMRAQAKEKRAEAERAQQDADAQGDAHSPGADQATGDAVEAGAQDAQADAQEQEREKAARAASAPKETRAQMLVRRAREEIAYQAEVLGVPESEHIKGALTNPDDPDTFTGAKAGKFLIAQRAQVIEALREQGKATAAEAYAKMQDAFPLPMDKVFADTDDADRADRVAQNAGAAAK